MPGASTLTSTWGGGGREGEESTPQTSRGTIHDCRGINRLFRASSPLFRGEEREKGREQVLAVLKSSRFRNLAVPSGEKGKKKGAVESAPRPSRTKIALPCTALGKKGKKRKKEEGLTGQRSVPISTTLPSKFMSVILTHADRERKEKKKEIGTRTVKV